MLNGRNYVTNDSTCLTANGHSVVDYSIVNHNDLSVFTDFICTNVTDIINSNGHDTVLTSAAFPDHSVLSWKLNFGNAEQLPSATDKSHEPALKIDPRNIPTNIFIEDSIVASLHETVFRLEKR